MALTKITGQVINTATDVTVGVLTVTDTLAVGGTVSVGGTLTYEDVTNIDSVGLITARNGIVVGSGITLSKDGDGFFTGIVTASSFVGGLPITNGADNRVITATSASAIQGESGLTFDGDILTLTKSSTTAYDTASTTNDSATNLINSGAAGHSTLQFQSVSGGSANTGQATISAFNESSGSKNTALTFGTRQNSDATVRERLRITSTGSVGINSTNPENNLLELYTDASAAWKFRIHTSVSDGAGFYQRANGDFELVLRDASNNNNHISGSAGGLQFSTSNSEKLRITSGGEVGIGTETIYSNSKLDVIDGIINVQANTTSKDARIQFTRKDTGIFGWLGIPNWNSNAFFFYVPKDSSPYNETGAVYESETWSIYSAGTHRLTINPSGHVLPAANDTYDLGSSSLRWRDIYTGDLNLSNKGKSNDVDGSWGDYTIQEGESDLFLINNRSGKKFKFNLTEVL